MKRIMIIGGPGSGKSTLARRLADHYALPAYHMDQIHWLPGWVLRPYAEKLPMAEAIVARDTWVFEGGFSRSYPARMARADLIIWLDLPVTLRLYRVITRSFRYRGQTRPDLPEGCPEQFNRQTLEFLHYIWRTRHSSRKTALSALAVPNGAAFEHLTSPKHVARFLSSLESR